MEPKVDQHLQDFFFLAKKHYSLLSSLFQNSAHSYHNSTLSVLFDTQLYSSTFVFAYIFHLVSITSKTMNFYSLIKKSLHNLCPSVDHTYTCSKPNG